MGVNSVADFISKNRIRALVKGLYQIIYFGMYTFIDPMAWVLYILTLLL